MNEAVKIFTSWATLQANDISMGAPLRDVQEYEKLHHEQFSAWCEVRSVDIKSVYSVCGFSGPGNSRAMAENNYKIAAGKGEAWLRNETGDCFCDYGNMGSANNENS